MIKIRLLVVNPPTVRGAVPSYGHTIHAVCCILILAPNKVGGTRAGKQNRTVIISHWKCDAITIRRYLHIISVVYIKL